MGLTLNGPFREVLGLGSSNIVAMILHGRSFGTQHKAIDIDEWSIGGGCNSERFYCTALSRDIL